jgi:membrane protein YdbS with pleckstrin-like domain
VGSARGLLNEDEELLAEVRPHLVVIVGPIMLLALALAGAITIALHFPNAPTLVAWLLAAMVLLPAAWAAARLARWRAVRFCVTTSRLLYRRGVLGRDVVQLRLLRVAEVHCSQSMGERMIGTGRLVFEVTGSEAPLVVDDVRWPRRLQRLINAQLDQLEAPYGARGYGTASDRPTARRGAPSRSWTTTPPHGVAFGEQEEAGAVPSVPRQILELDELRRRGILSDDEFAAKKAQLLGRM